MATYKIKYGDTLSQIAANNNTTVDEILKANPNITDRNKIYAGSELNLPEVQAQQQVPTSAGSTNLNNGSTLMKSNIGGVSDEQYTALNTKPVVDSQAYQNATALVEQLSQQMKQPGKYTDQLDQILGNIMNREEFAYDFNTDPLFQQMKSSYEAAGKQAQENAVARSAALSGGYANSWSQVAGQQAYDQYVQEAYSQLPAYYQLALDAYNMEGNKLLEQYSLLSSEDQKEFDRILTQLNLATSERDSIWNKEYTTQADYLNNLAMLAQMSNAEYWNQKNFDYQVQQDAIANAQRAAAVSAQEDETENSIYDQYLDIFEKALDVSPENASRVLSGFGLTVDEEDAILAASGRDRSIFDAEITENVNIEIAKLKSELKNMLPREQQTAISRLLKKYEGTNWYNTVYRAFY